MTEPTTEAGKALYIRLSQYYPPVEYDGWADWIAAVEAEAVADLARLAAIGEAVERLPDYWTVEKLEGGGWRILDSDGWCQNGKDAAGEVIGIDTPSTLDAAIAAADTGGLTSQSPGE